MRQCLKFTENTLPLWKAKPSAKQTDLATLRYNDWTASDFAGFRRILDPKSPEAPDLAELKRAVDKHKPGIKNLVVLGTGGSSLGTETIVEALHSPAKNPRVFVMDNNDPDFFHQHLALWEPKETLVFAVSKSGKTPETISQLLVLIEHLKSELGDSWKKHVVLCTDPKSGDFRAFGKSEGLTTLDVPSAVGGRFSVLTPVGLFPAMFVGIDPRELLAGAKSLVDAWEKLPVSENPAFQMAYALAQDEKNITVFMPYSSRLKAFSRWFSQLWAESLGKDGKGLTPYPAIGTTDQHSQVQLYMEGPRNKNFVLLQVKETAHDLPLTALEGTNDLPAFAELRDRTMMDLFQAEYRATRDAMVKNKLSVACIEVDKLDAFSLGALFYFWEWATLYAGALLDIDPFNQPGVEAAKKLTKQYLAEI
jgi:glucose-6-phosphate isomerase